MQVQLLRTHNRLLWPFCYHVIGPWSTGVAGCSVPALRSASIATHFLFPRRGYLEHPKVLHSQLHPLLRSYSELLYPYGVGSRIRVLRPSRETSLMK